MVCRSMVPAAGAWSANLRDPRRCHCGGHGRRGRSRCGTHCRRCCGSRCCCRCRQARRRCRCRRPGRRIMHHRSVSCDSGKVFGHNKVMSLMPHALHHAGDAHGQLPTDADGPLGMVLGPLEAPLVAIAATSGQQCMLMLAVAPELTESGDQALVRSPELGRLLDRESRAHPDLASHALVNPAPHHRVVLGDVLPVVKLVEIAVERLL